MTETRESTTQEDHPIKTVIRTLFQMIVGFAPVFPAIVQASGVNETTSWVAGGLAISAGITRVMALPAVENFLQRFFPWLSAGDK